MASRFAPAAKLDRIRALDARLELVDGDFDTARERAPGVEVICVQPLGASAMTRSWHQRLPSTGRAAVADGRLDPAELGERADAALAARTIDADDNTPETLHVRLVGRMRHGRIGTRWLAPRR